MLQPVKFFILLLLCSCSSISQNELQPIHVNSSEYISKKQELTDNERQNWQHKDILEDSIPGISFEKASKYVEKEQIQDTVIVAVIDTEFNVYLEHFKDNVWINRDEIPNNNIDDDGNGYIDDINGWNFIAKINGNYTKHSHFESTRILKRFDSLLTNRSDTITILGDNYNLYKKAQKEYIIQLKASEKRQKHGNYLVNNYDKAFKTVKEYFPNKDYTKEKLDSLYILLKDSNKEKANLIYYVSDCIRLGLTKDWMRIYKSDVDNIKEKCLNFDYNERENIGDNPNDVNDSLYGSPKLFNDKDFISHSSQVASIVVNHNEKKFLKIMPIVISSIGDEHDKDLANSIRYAVNNGAKVINMSLGKELSFNRKWIESAVRYAAKKDALIIYAAGNEANNIDNIEHKYYPNDIDDFGNEIVGNFISVGASTKSLDENLVANFSNYNKKHVDIFAPGDSIYVYSPKGNNYYNRGTSLAAPMVSKIAALIRSYYPNLTASEVKQIIMESGISYDIMVNKPSRSKEKELVPFSSLSKSGKIVNAYNALLLAEKISKKKKKRN